MFPPNLIVARRIRGRCEIASKKRLLETLAELLATECPELTATTIFDRLLERERLGSTGLGHGVALPHARLAELQAPLGAFVQTRAGIAFDAIDDQPVDLAFALLVPDVDHDAAVLLLGELASLFNDSTLRAALRAVDHPEALLRVFRAWNPATP